MSTEVKCPVEGCVFKPKSQRSLNVHSGIKHDGAALTLPDVVLAETFSPKVEIPKGKIKEEVIFFSPRKPSMTIIVSPDQWKEVDTPAGTKLIQSKGKLAQFEAGQYRTTDPEIITYLEETYDDPRHPILSNRQMREMAAR